MVFSLFLKIKIRSNHSKIELWDWQSKILVQESNGIWINLLLLPKVLVSDNLMNMKLQKELVLEQLQVNTIKKL